jgi:hypothetical protein
VSRDEILVDVVIRQWDQRCHVDRGNVVEGEVVKRRDFKSRRLDPLAKADSIVT